MDVRRYGGVTPIELRSTVRVVSSFLLALCLAFLCCLAFPSPIRAQSSICAEVKIQINQRVSFERQAFDAMLRIRNGLEGVQVERIDVNLTFKDLEGHESSGLFFHRLDTTTDIMGSVEDGTGVVAASTTGEAHWLIIPTAGAGGTTGIGYEVGAAITYRMTGDATDRTVEVTPEVITVRPQPLLTLDYFLPGYVYADDPLTPDVVEPTVPFTLGVRISNTGYGAAAHTTIESAQPEIVRNNQDLLVDFQIIGSYVDDQPAQPSLLIDFGDIESGQSRMGRWLMTTTLSGQFFDFEAEYTHADELGGELTSLISGVTPHLLTHDVLMVRSGRDGVRDFLAQAIDATDFAPYRIYESDGAVSEVEHEFNPTFTGSTLSFPALQGTPLYARQQIGFDGQGRSVGAIRTDNREFVPPENIWFSKRRNASGDGWVYFLNLFESDASCGGATTCTYELIYDDVPAPASLAGSVYEDFNANGTQDAGEQGLSGVSVTLSDGEVQRVATTLSDGSFRFSNLPAATYSLMVGALADHYDGLAIAGTAGGTASSNTISDIVLATGVEAAGYQFAKIPMSAQATADLAITQFTASNSSPRVGETFSLTLQATNIGPDTTDAGVDLILPSGLQALSASASAGTFDSVTGHWAIGSLDPAVNRDATLVLQVRADIEGTANIPAAVASTDASVLDPNPANNNGTLSLQVLQAKEVRLTAAFARESRFLVFVGCDPEVTESQCSAIANQLDVYLTNRSVEHLVVKNAADFRAELRSGHWNVYWLHGRPGLLEEAVRTEVALAVLRGDSLILDGAHDAGSVAFETLVGANYGGMRPAGPAEELEFPPNDDLNFSGLLVSGERLSYQATTAAVLAVYPDEGPAVLRGLHGNGRAYLFAFDLAASLIGDGAYAPFFDQIATAARPPIPSSFSDDAYIPVNLHLDNLGASVEADVVLAIPQGARVLAVEPPATQTSAQQLAWRRTFAPSATFDARIGLRASDPVTSPITVEVVEVEAPGENLAHQDLALQIVGTSARVASARNAISSLAASSTADSKHKANALTGIDAAATAHTNGQPNVGLERLLYVDDELAQIVGVDTTAARIELAWLLQAFEREWYSGLSACAAQNAEPVADSGISFSPFAANEGFFMRETSGGFDWRLGADTAMLGAYTSMAQNLTDDFEYAWWLTYDSEGNGTFRLQAVTTLVNSMIYTAPVGQLLRSGNGLHLSVEVLGGSTENRIAVEVLTLETASFSDVMSVAATTTPAKASLYYYGEAMRDGFEVSGTIAVKRSISIGMNVPRISFSAQSGSLSCKTPDR